MTARLSTLALLLALTGALVACDGDIKLPSMNPVIGPDPVVDAGPPPCEPTGAVVPKLLRLSNFEYQNIVTDLLGVPVDGALFSRWTPVAVVYGFDTMSETRVDQQALEEQLATAESLASLVMATPALLSHCPPLPAVQTPVCTSKAAYSALDDFSDTQGRECWSYFDSAGNAMSFDNAQSRWRKLPDETALLWNNGAHPGPTVDPVRRWLAPVDGRVTLSGSFSDGDPGGGDGVVVTIEKNGAVLFTRDIANAGAAASFNLQVDVAQNERLSFIVSPKANTNNDATGFTAQIAFRPTPRKAAWTWSSCAQPLISRLASRAFRRPVRTDELADYQALFETNLMGATSAGIAEPADEALTATLQAVFLSPNFVFKPELVPNGLDPKEASFGIASRLALFTRASIADEPLWMLAGMDGLSSRQAIHDEALRLLDQNINRFATHFGGQWLDYRESPPLGPLTADLQQESKAVFSAVLTENLLPERLMSPGFTIVSQPLATHYGLMFGMGGTTQRGRVDTTARGGLLDQGGFLMRTANGSEFRRPIHRGLWVLTRLLCRELPRLDPATLTEISASFDAIDRSLPLPKQMELHRNSATRCGSCHSQMDPIGLALEKYDPQGLWRDTYANGAPIETNLQFNNTVVSDPHELSKALESSSEFRSCVAEKVFTFGLNRGPGESELCVPARIANPLDGSKPTFKDITLDALIRALELTEVKQ